MSRIRFLLDENISPAVRNQLLFHEPSLQVACIGDKAAPAYGTSDEKILKWIEQTGQILVSRNRRTMPVHLQKHLAAGGSIPGMLLLRRRTSMSELIEELLLIWHASHPEEFQNTIRYVPL